MDWVFWVILSGILLAVAISFGSILIASRRNKELESSQAPEELPPVEAVAPAPISTAETGTPQQGGLQSVGPESGGGEPETVEVLVEQAEFETPEAPTSRMVRLRRRLASSNNALARALAQLLSSNRIDDDTWGDFEATLISSDLGVAPTAELVEGLRAKLSIDGISEPAQAKQILHDALVGLVNPDMDRSLNLNHADAQPAVVMLVGVNGTGKTTTVGKLGRMLVAEGKHVLFGAADTFRAAAAEQLGTWGERVGVDTVRGDEGADPASVAFAAVEEGIKHGVDVVLVDTAGRLHTKVGLMDELGKVKRVIEKQVPVSEVLLVLDATTGQNGLTQARIFADVVDVTGIVLTKLDGSAKGGIVVQVQRELGVPVKLIGLGEGPDDLAPFDPEQFVTGLLGE